MGPAQSPAESIKGIKGGPRPCGRGPLFVHGARWSCWPATTALLHPSLLLPTEQPEVQQHHAHADRLREQLVLVGGLGLHQVVLARCQVLPARGVADGVAFGSNVPSAAAGYSANWAPGSGVVLSSMPTLLMVSDAMSGGSSGMHASLLSADLSSVMNTVFGTPPVYEPPSPAVHVPSAAESASATLTLMRASPEGVTCSGIQKRSSMTGVAPSVPEAFLTVMV